MNHILYHIFNINLTLSSKKHETVPGNPSIKTYVNKTGIICNNNIWIMFKIKTGYFLEILMPETMKLQESAKTKR